MSVVFAMRETDDAILIGADSQRSDDVGLKSTFHKLRQIATAPIAWACTGNGDLGNVFSAWLMSQRWPPTSWGEFERALQKELARLNGEQRRLTGISGAPWRPDYGMSCLLAAWYDGQPHIESYDDDGLKASLTDVGYGALGSGRPHVTIAFETLELLNLQGLLPVQRCHHVLRVACVMDKECGMPIDVWRVRQDGIQSDVLEELNAEREATDETTV